MIRPIPNDIWVSSSVDGSQIVYHIKELFPNKLDHHLFNYRYKKGVDMVLYKVMNAKGEVRTLSYPLDHFLNRPTGSHGRCRKLAVRVNSGH